MTSWTLPTVETHTNADLSRLMTFLEGYNLVALLGDEGVFVLNSYFQLLCDKLEFFTQDQGGMLVKYYWVLHLLFCNRLTQWVQIIVADYSERLLISCKLWLFKLMCEVLSSWWHC
jgi:hypothetical protein